MHQQAVTDLEIGSKSCSCHVWLTPGQPQRVQIAYQQVWQVLQGNSSQFDVDEDESVELLYENVEALTAFAREGPAE